MRYTSASGPCRRLPEVSRDLSLEHVAVRRAADAAARRWAQAAIAGDTAAAEEYRAEMRVLLDRAEQLALHISDCWGHQTCTPT